ncbi:1598_t:CDS:2, partial [Entrophospora sp. SA101]
MNRFLQCISGEIPEFIPVPPHSLHLKPQVKKNTTSDTDSVEEITKCLANMSLKMAKNINVRYCSNCGRIGHNFRSSKQTTLEETIRKIIQNKAIIDSKNSALQKDEEEETLDGPMRIDFVQKKEPATDVVTTKCKIKRLMIPTTTVDPGANLPIMTEDIAKRLKLVIDTKEKHDLSGIATTPTESIGIVRNVPVTFTRGCTIHSDFAVVSYHKPMLILPNTLRDKYDYDLHFLDK